MNIFNTIFTTCRVCLYLFLSTFFLYSYNSVAQDLPCANEIFQTQQLKDTAFVRQVMAIAILQQQNGTTQRTTGNILEIPIAVHVLHLGELVGTGTNISDQQIYDAVQATNERWRNTSATNDTRSVDMEVQFCLAQFDPDGNPSNGITRTDASAMPLYADVGIGYIQAQAIGITGADEIATKNLSNWSHSYVYNIWVVNKIAGNWGGYAFFPVNGEYSTDGVVITANSMRSIYSTLAHELGHGMSLFHTFQGSENGCASNDICFLQGDWICDTPPHRQVDCDNSTCNNSPDSILSMRNIMSYCNGRGLFTQDQKDRVRTSIYNTSRAQLLRSTACTGVTTYLKNQTTDKPTVYPNPSNGNFTLIADVKPTENITIEITNNLGQIIAQQELATGKEHNLYLFKKLAKGIYQLQLKKDGVVIGSSLVNVN